MKLNIFPIVMVILCLAFLSGCSIPNLEEPQCTEARDAVKEAYSIHFGNSMKPSEEYLKIRKPFITASFNNFISKQITDKRDFFTLTEDYPKAFRVGTCKTLEENRTLLEILLFWKDDTRSEQRSIHVEAVKEDGKWLIDKVQT